MTITVIDEADSGVDCARLGRLGTYLLGELRLHPDADLGITLVGEDRMTELHEAWMDEPGPTDVLSFPIDELRAGEPVPGVLGDIVLCPAFAARQAQESGRPLADELDLLVVHGMLHLVGHDHGAKEEQEAMFALQDALLASWVEAR